MPITEPSHGRSHAPRRLPSEFQEDLAALEAAFDRALDGLRMVFQPIVHAREPGSIFGYEALVRSDEPALPHPGALLDAAEQLMRLEKLGRAIRARVADVYASAPSVRGVVFVNLHALDLLDPALLSRFAPLTRLADRVILEVTERTSLDDVGDLRYRLAELRALGFRIAIDDLGAGHARMARLAPLDTDFVKLDMSLVRGIDRDPMKRQLVAAVTSLCREQGIVVIGEGVETDDEARTLVDLGCDLLQGYLFARPGPPFPEVGKSR